MKTTNILFEVGLEEMPARFMDDTEQQLKTNTIQWLEEIRLSYNNLTTYTTPRRFAVLIEGLAYKQEDQEEEAKGPAAKIVKDEEGNWTKAAIGFSKGQGKTVEDIYFKEVKGTEYAFVNKFIEGKTQETLLPGFKDIILGLYFPKNMRWADQTLRFIRPIKWIVALQDNQVIPIEIAGVHASNISYGHRFLGDKLVMDEPTQYETVMEDQYVIVDKHKREQLIIQGIEKLKQTKDWIIPMDQELLREVTHLVEYPTVFHGSYSENFLNIPKEVLITSMKEHQRYFPVQSKNGDLLPHFVAVRNGTNEHIETVSRGNEKVLHARLQDAEFFYEEDQKVSIDHNLKQLDRMVFQESLGTIADKVSRVRQIAAMMAKRLDVTEKEQIHIDRAAEICKFDLVTNMVNEFTELQGVMGQKYAKIFGENEIVAQAIEEHYLPKNAQDSLPNSIVGSVVSVADKLDTIVGCHAIGLIPSGSQDPYALRRQALGVLQIFKANEWEININELLEDVLKLFEDKKTSSTDEETLRMLEAFFKQRVAYIMKEQLIDGDVVDAILANQLSNFSFLLQKGKILTEKRNDPEFKDTQEAFVRVINLASKAEDNIDVDPTIFKQEEEADLYKAYNNIKDDYHRALAKSEAKEALQHLSQLVAPIHQFFDHTMVMDKDDTVRQNRLALLQSIALILMEFADLTKVQWKQHQA